MRTSLVVMMLLTASWTSPAEAGRKKSRLPPASAPSTNVLAGGPYSLVSLQGGQLRLVRPITFQLTTPTILPASYDLLHEIARVLKLNPQLRRVRVEGHTDGRGASEYNKRVSQQRATAVRDFLVQQGVAASRLEALGVGKDQPIDTNLTEAGRLRNRRIDVVIIDPPLASSVGAGGPTASPGPTPSGPSVAPRSPATDAARAHFARGMKLFKAQRYEAALAAFRAALASEPNAALHYNIGVCLESLGRNGAAIAAFRRFLSQQPSGAVATEVRNRIAKLKRKP
jgi:outer membrane protein OmpA-like peptidoglycan-associated protein